MACYLYSSFCSSTREIQPRELGGNRPDAEKVEQMAHSHEPNTDVLQLQLGYNAVLPTPSVESDRTALEKCGVVFGATIPGLPAFTFVNLPAGWTLVPGVLPGHIHGLLDGQGRIRARVEIRSDIKPTQRYDLSVMASHHRKETWYEVRDVNGEGTFGEKIFTTGAHSYTGRNDGEDARVKQDLARGEAEAWLDEHRPNWRDPAKSWDE